MGRKPRETSTIVTVHRKQKNGSVYVYEQKYEYSPETKRTKRVSNTLVGKILPGSDEVVPTRPKKVVHPDGTRTPRNDLGNPQLAKMLDWAGKESGIDAALSNAMGDVVAKKVSSFARFLTTTDGGSPSQVEQFQYSHPMPSRTLLTGEVRAELFDGLGGDERARQRFFLDRAARLGHNSLFAVDCNIALPDEDEESEGKGQGRRIRVLVLYAVKTMEPLAFVRVPGHTTDRAMRASLTKQLAFLDISVPRLVTGNAYWNEMNMGIMAHDGIDFIASANPSWGWIREKIEEASDTIQSPEHLDPLDRRTYVQSVQVMHAFDWERMHGSTSKGLKAGDVEKVERKVWIHVCFDPALQEREDAEFGEWVGSLAQELRDGVPLDEMSEAAKSDAARYLIVGNEGDHASVRKNEEACEAACRTHGFFVVVANREKDGFAALHKYRQHQHAEKFLNRFEQVDADGTADGARDAQLIGQLTVQFAGLCYSDFFRQRIQQMKTKLSHGAAEAPKREGLPAPEEVDWMLLEWLDRNSLVDILAWFDMREKGDVSPAIRETRWNPSVALQDKRFMELLKDPAES